MAKTRKTANRGEIGVRHPPFCEVARRSLMIRDYHNSQPAYRPTPQAAALRSRRE